jgi:hypothetical protein
MDETLEISRGKNAARLLEDPLFVEALEAIKARCRKKSEDSLPSQGNVREAAYWLMSATKELESHLTSFMNTGKMATVAKETREGQELQERRLTEWDGSPDGIA